MKPVFVRKFQEGEEFAVSEVIRTTLAISNRKDYSPEFIEENIRSHSPEVILSRAKEAHLESYLLSVFVLPEYQGKGVGRSIIETLESDEYFCRAWRTEVGSSLTAVQFYRKMGYEYKDGVTTPDEYGVVRLEKRIKCH
ncbi:MAG: GNAT family N-acetyltransferase [Lachnospiraceae bacterium]